MTKPDTPADPAPTGMRGFLRTFGPCLVTGAADEDLRGIGTHSQIGVAFG